MLLLRPSRRQHGLGTLDRTFDGDQRCRATLAYAGARHASYRPNRSRARVVGAARSTHLLGVRQAPLDPTHATCGIARSVHHEPTHETSRLRSISYAGGSAAWRSLP